MAPNTLIVRTDRVPLTWFPGRCAVGDGSESLPERKMGVMQEFAQKTPSCAERGWGYVAFFAFCKIGPSVVAEADI
jgi:hypothetical protein